MTPSEPIGRRIVPGTGTHVSELGIALDPGPAVAPTADRQQVGSLRRAHALGITLYDVAGARSPSRAERLLRSAFPEPDPSLTVVVGLGADPSGARSGAEPARTRTRTESEWSESAMRTWLAQVRSRLPPGASIVPEVRRGSLPAEEMRACAAALGPLVARQELLSWSTRIERAALLAGDPIEGLASPVVSAELSLLDAASLAPMARGTRRGVPALLVRDPFAGGRLDGSLLAPEIADRRPGQPPRDLRELREELAPVLRLGFLTRQHKRTLAVAALRYLLQREETLSVLVPLPPPERWDEIFSAPGAAPLDREELARLEGGDLAPERVAPDVSGDK